MNVNIRRGVRWLALLLTLVMSLLLGVISLVYLQQDKLIAEALIYLNEGFEGRIQLADSHISPFKQFPNISVDLENLEIYEGKDEDSELIVHVNDAFIGFDILSIIKGNYDIHSIELSDGLLRLVQHTDGSFNVVKALSSSNMKQTDSLTAESLHLDLQSIKLENIDLIKLNEVNNVMVEAYVNSVVAKYKTIDDNIEMAIDGNLLFNLIIDEDTSFLHDKHIELETAIVFDATKQVVKISPSELLIEKGQFLMEGEIDLANNLDLNLHFAGRKPNFDLFLAFVPEELLPLVQRYENGGNIYFEATVKGPSINGFNPQIEIDFGASEAFVKNTVAGKAVNDLNFKGHFTNGAQRDATTMSLTIQDFSARPETGEFEGALTVSNFASPDIEMKVISRFDLDFLAGFLNLNDLSEVNGNISLELNFHDIIDLSQPEKSIEKLNESYFTRLEVKNLNFRNTGFKLPIQDLNILAVMDGHEASIDQLAFKVGNSNLSIKATVSDLPAILHHTNTPVNVVMDIKSDLLDLEELTGATTDSMATIKEQIKDLRMRFSFNSSARAFTESLYLPTGEFYIEDLHAGFTNYPHELHDFHADVLIADSILRIIDFTGMIDQSDFHFNGMINNYGLWFTDSPEGLTTVDFNLNSKMLQLDDLFTYGGENYVPADYRHEEFKNFILHGMANLNYSKKLQKAQITIDRLESTMKVHPLRFENFSGSIEIDDQLFRIHNFGGSLGNTIFKADYTYFFKADSTSQQLFSLRASRLDFDQLFAYNPPPNASSSVDHDAGFNIFSVPFPNLKVELDIENLNYHRYKIADFSMQARTRTNHYIYLDTLSLKAAEGQISMNGYFNGSNPKEIYLSPKLQLSDVDLDKLMVKFENFGQDQLVSDNLHGRLSGEITGNIHLHADMIPSIEDSRLHIDFAVLDGSLNNFAPFTAMSDYFTDKNLAKVRFDTLKNDLYLENGVLTIPRMNINSTLGYFELSGKQAIDLDMDYTMRIPVKVVTKAAFQKLFGSKGQEEVPGEDSIQYRDASKRTRFVNINIKGTPDSYKVTLGNHLEN